MSPTEEAINRPVIDGFCYDLTRLFVPGWYEPMALGQLEAIRKSGLYRARWHAVPEEPVALAAYDTLEQQVRIVPGSYLWGIASSVLGALLVRIVEGSTGIPFMNDFVYGSSLSAPTAGGTHHPILLTQPRLITDPGWVQVEISNTSAAMIAAANLQLVLLCAEPCVVIEEAMELSECI